MNRAQPRRARVKALAKVNLSLKVLHKRPDGFHELRTIFQTISLGDVLDIEYLPSSRTVVEIDSNVEIADNLAVRAARSWMETAKVTGQVKLRLRKRIPMARKLPIPLIVRHHQNHIRPSRRALRTGMRMPHNEKDQCERKSVKLHSFPLSLRSNPPHPPDPFFPLTS